MMNSFRISDGRKITHEHPSIPCGITPPSSTNKRQKLALSQIQLIGDQIRLFNKSIWEDELDTIIESHELSINEMNKLSTLIEVQGPHISDLYLMIRMTETNHIILEGLKKDQSIQQRMKEFFNNNGIKSVSCIEPPLATIPEE